MKSKKGLELSLTVIVLIILSIIIFIGAISLVWNFFKGAEEIKGTIERNTQEQIEALLRQGTEITAIPINSKAATYGQEATFGLGIRNIKPAGIGYYSVISFSGIYDKKGQTIDGGDSFYIEEKWLGGFKTQGPVEIQPNKFEIVPLRIRVATTIGENQPTPKGAILAFNVCVFDNSQYTDCLANTPKENIYGNKIRQVFVEVK